MTKGSTENETASIIVASAGAVPESEFEPLLHELQEPFAEVDFKQRYGGGGGPIDPHVIITVVTIYALGSYARGFFAKAGEAHYERLHYHLSRFLKHLTLEYSGAIDQSDVVEELPRFAPMEISIGRAHFYFREELSPEEIVRRLRKAQDYIDTLPEQDLQPATLKDEFEAGGPYNLFWNSNTESWVEIPPRSGGYT